MCAVLCVINSLLMFSIEINNEIITDIANVDLQLLKCHESVIPDKVNLLKKIFRITWRRNYYLFYYSM
jgi:hypothetical protein